MLFNATAVPIHSQHITPCNLPLSSTAATSSLAILQAEYQRVKSLADAVSAHQTVAEKTQLASTDPNGDVLRWVLQWRLQRHAALAAEAERLASEVRIAEATSSGQQQQQQQQQQQGRDDIYQPYNESQSNTAACNAKGAAATTECSAPPAGDLN